MKKSKIFSLVLAGTLAIGALSGCSSNAAPAASAPAASAETPAASAEAPAASAETPAAPVAEAPTGAAEGKIVVATANETPSMTVAEHNAVAGSYMNQLTHSGLFTTDAISLAAVPELVESYEAVTDLEWHFKIYEGIKFHNGEEMTADDVVASLYYVKQFPDCEQYQKNIKVIEKVDDYTVKITTDEPYAMLLDDLAHHGNWIMPKSLIDGGNDFNANPIGSGAYQFVKWTYGDSVDFVAFDDYFDTENKPHIKDMTWRTIPEGSSRTIALEAGEVDFIVEVATQDIPRMEADDKITVFMTPGTSHNFMMINNELPEFSNPLVRKALDMAIDKEAIIGVAYDGLAVPAYSQVPTNFQGASTENINSYDPEGAKSLLAEAGVDPASIKFSIICSDDVKRRVGEVIQSSLAEIGIMVELETLDLATYLSVTADGDYQAALGGYTSSNLLSYLNGVWHGASINASNKTRTNREDVNNLIDKALVTVDEAERIAIMEECTAILNEHCGQVPTFQPFVVRAYNSKLVVPEIGASGKTPLHKVYWSE